ncbi:MAG: endolytic transglycosylase MltG [Moraxella sp.]|nr:endolytic transglycosylase MltG [Moraxella sp.]
MTKKTLRAHKILNTPIKHPKPPKSPKQTQRWWLSPWIWAVAVLMIVAGVVYGSIFAKTDSPKQVLTVAQGDTYQSVLLKKPWQEGVFSSKLVIKAYLKMVAKAPLHTGVYHIPANASVKEVVSILQQGAEVAMVRVQLIEGKTTKDLYHALKTTEGITLEVLSPKQEHYTWADVAVDNQAVANALNITTPNGNLEGWFAPDTYYYAKGVSDVKILTDLYQAQQKRLDQAWKNRDANVPYKTAYEMLIMASIIEKETGEPDERTKVSAVFVNRLAQGMRLQTDPTIIYGLFDRYDGKIYRSNINEKTDYNTYQIDGLPPTPIALPSAKAIEAAAHPDKTEVLYFVATGKGGHTFSKTLDEHNKAVAEYRKVMSENK